MLLDVSWLRYFGYRNTMLPKTTKTKQYRTKDEIKSDNLKSAKSMISSHNRETDLKLKELSEQHAKGQMSDTDYKFAKLEANGNAIVYQLGVNSLYNV